MAGRPARSGAQDHSGAGSRYPAARPAPAVATGAAGTGSAPLCCAAQPSRAVRQAWSRCRSSVRSSSTGLSRGSSSSASRILGSRRNVALPVSATMIRPPRQLPYVHLHMGGLPGGLDDGEQQPEEHALEHVGDDDGARGDHEDHRLTAMLPPHRHQLSARHQLHPGVHQHGRERGERDDAERGRQQRREQQQPDTVQDARELGAGTGLDVGGTAHDHRGHRQRAEHTAEGVARTLRHQLLVVVGPRPVGHPVHRGGAEEALGGGDEGEGEHRAEDGQPGETAEFAEPRRLDGLQQTVHLHLRDRQSEHGRHGGGDGDGGQRARHLADLLGHPLPQQEQAEGAGPDGERGGRLRAADQLGGEPGEPGDLRRSAAGLRDVGHGVDLAEDEDEADTGQHPLHHGDGYRPEPPAEAQRPEGDLQHTRGEHDGTERREPVLLHGLVDKDGQSGRGPADLEGTARQRADDETADDAGDQPEFGGYAGRDGDTHTQRDGDEEDDERGEDITPQRVGAGRGELRQGELRYGGLT